jgi:hypothetical protein
MRPRISPNEAKYLCELLQASQAILEKHGQYFNALKQEVSSLEELKKIDTYKAVVKEGLTAKKLELEQYKQRLAFNVHYNKRIHNLLLEKYGNMAKGNKHKGTYKTTNNRLDLAFITCRTGSLNEVLINQPLAEVNQQ